MRVGVTDNFKPNLHLYMQWLRGGYPGVDIIVLSYRSDNLQDLSRCDGLLLTGGGDVDPRLYNQAECLAEVRGVDRDRDEFEFSAVERALKLEIPMLGICRGLQVTNVVFGGSLIPDLVSRGYPGHCQAGGAEVRHAVAISVGTMLHDIVTTESANVNSAHHQAAERVGEGLRVSARSVDDVPEALEWSEQGRKPFLLLVQWHPERMKDFDNPASSAVLQRFLSEIRKSEEVQRK